MSGYDLKKEFENGLVHIWSVNLSQIYPTLKKMNEDGFVVAEAAAPHLGPARIIYRRTQSGQRQLIEWLQKGPIETKGRLHSIAQTYFLYELEDSEQAIEFFQAHLNTLNTWQGTMETIDSFWREGRGDSFFDDLPLEDFYPYLTLDLGLRKNNTQIEWCQECIKRIRARQKAK